MSPSGTDELCRRHTWRVPQFEVKRLYKHPCHRLVRINTNRPMQLQDLAQVVRSKNAGPRRITLDVIFRSDADYQRATQSEALIAEKIAPLYGVAVDAVTVINYPLGRAIKIVVPRQIMSGDPGDRDVYGAQQHTPLLRLEI
jgi:Domain of unknown function (DUF4387)